MIGTRPERVEPGLDPKTASWHSGSQSANDPLTIRVAVLECSAVVGTLDRGVPKAPERRVHQMKLKPLGDRLIVKAVEEEETTASGLVLPDTAKEKPQKGKVLAVGDGKLDDNGQRVPLDVAEGDEVLYSKYGGTEIVVEGEDLLVLRESDVLAKVQS